MFKWNRVLVALIGVPLLFFVYMGEAFFHMNLQGLPMLIFTNLVVAIGTYEFYKMVKIIEPKAPSTDFFGLISVKPFLKNFLPIATPTIPAAVSDIQTKTCKTKGNIAPIK